MRKLVLLLAARSRNDPLPPPPEKKPEPPPPAVKMTSDPGACNLAANGAYSGKELEMSAAGGAKHWNPEEGAGFRLECKGKDLRLSIASKPDTSVPFGEQGYDAKDLVVLGRAGTTQLADFVGTVKIMEFDTKHFTGMVSLVGAGHGGKVKLEGEFDIKRQR